MNKQLDIPTLTPAEARRVHLIPFTVYCEGDETIVTGHGIPMHWGDWLQQEQQRINGLPDRYAAIVSTSTGRIGLWVNDVGRRRQA